MNIVLIHFKYLVGKEIRYVDSYKLILAFFVKLQVSLLGQEKIFRNKEKIKTKKR